jgi:hypothetical protein
MACVADQIEWKERAFYIQDVRVSPGATVATTVVMRLSI